MNLTDLGTGRSANRGIRVGDVVVLKVLLENWDVVLDVTVDVTIGAGVVVIARGDSDDGTVLVCTRCCCHWCCCSTLIRTMIGCTHKPYQYECCRHYLYRMVENKTVYKQIKIK